MRPRRLAARIGRVDPEECLRRLGGVATRQVLVRATSRGAFDTAVRRGVIVRDGYGRYALPETTAALRAANALGAVVSHRSAAVHHGWAVKTVPVRPELTVRRNRVVATARRMAVTLHRADLAAEDRDGPVTSVRRTLHDCLRALPFDEALTVADSALREGLPRKVLTDVAARVRGPGAPQARRVAAEATALAANPFESVLRAIALDVPGLALRPQVVIGDGEEQGRADLVDEELGLVVEAESHSFHSNRAALRRDCRRYTLFTLLGWRVLRFAWEDVMYLPLYVRQCLAAAVALGPVVPRGAGWPGSGPVPA